MNLYNKIYYFQNSPFSVKSPGNLFSVIVKPYIESCDLLGEEFKVGNIKLLILQ